MIKKIVKFVIVLVIAIFLFLFFWGSNIYKSKITEKKDLTEAQIKKFEEDIKNGIEIDLEDYIVKDKDFSNRITKINSNISDIINYGFRKLFEYLLKNINI